MMREELPSALDGERLDRVVALMTGVTRAESAAFVDDGRATLDGVVVTTGSRRVKAGQVLELDLPDAVVFELAADAAVDVPVVFADDDVIVVDKPAGLVVHPGSGVERGTLVQGLLVRYPELRTVGEPLRPGIVHRLDKGTSGLLVVARSERAYTGLVAQLAARTAKRTYTALVWGVPETVRGVVDAPIGRSQRVAGRMAVAEGGKEARTAYEVRDAFRRPVPTALLTCRLETGRTHQIRVHLAAIGHPVVGDAAYGGDKPLVIACPRPFLHAAELGFVHPGSGAPMHFASPLPDDLVAVLAGLERDEE